MKVDVDIVRAYAETYSRAELVVIRKAAVVAHSRNLPRVEVTGANFKEGGSQGVYVEGETKEVMAICNAAIDYLDRDEEAEALKNPQVNHLDFSNRAARG